MIKAEELIAKFQQELDDHWGYIWCTAGIMWTEARQKQLEKTTDENRAMSRKYGSQWIGHMVADCSGLFSWAFDQLGGYMYHGSNTMWDSYCTGVSAIVTGDHVWNQKELLEFLDDNNRIVRPLNYSDNLAGVGARVIPLDSGQKILVAEVVGRVFMDTVESPVIKVEQLLQKYKLARDVDAIFIDIHAEATAEKQAFARCFDGCVSAIIGSHTHVPTADAVILPKGTAYQTDVGMCGNYDSVIGFEPAAPIERLRDKSSPSRLEPKGGNAQICGVFIETDNKTGLAVKITPFKY